MGLPHDSLGFLRLTTTQSKGKVNQMQISEQLAKEFFWVRKEAMESSGQRHEYYLGKQVGMAMALALVYGVQWVEAHEALHKAANAVAY